METSFLKVLNMSIAASYVMVAVLILRLALKRAPKRISYSLWSVVLFRLVCPVSLSSAFSVFARLGKTTSSGGIEYIPPDIGVSGANTVVGNLLPAATPEAGANPLQIIIFAGACVWLAGIAAMLIYSVVSYLRLQRRTSEATLLFDNVFETDEIASPFVCGFTRPKVYLPVGLSDGDRDYVLRHERTHIDRKDHLVKPFSFLVLSVHWFNPFMWLAFLLMSCDMEMSCDERVVRDLDADGRAGYSSALVHLAVKRPILAGSPLAFGESGTQERVKNVLNYRKPAFWVSALAIIAVIIAAACLLTNPAKTVNISFEVPGNIPQAVREYAIEYVQSDVAYYNSLDDQEIADAKITSLTHMNTGTASLTVDISMWLLEYRLLPKDPDKVVLAGGMTLEDGWRTEYSSMGQPLLVLVHDIERDIESEAWQRVGVTHTGTVLEEHQGDYTAATMAMYRRFLANAAGGVEWEFMPARSSVFPALPVHFDMSADEIYVSVDSGTLYLNDNTQTPNYIDCGQEMTYRKDDSVLWSPMAGDSFDSSKVSTGCTLSFEIRGENGAVGSGSISVIQKDSAGSDTIGIWKYTVTLIESEPALSLVPADDYSGGCIVKVSQ